MKKYIFTFVAVMTAVIFPGSSSADSWKSAGQPSKSQIHTIAINFSGHLFAGVSGEGIYRSLDNGRNWKAINSGLKNLQVTKIAIQENGSLFAGSSSGLFRSTDNGENWSGPFLEQNAINSFIFHPNGNVYAGSDLNGIFCSSDNGSSWKQITYSRLLPQLYGLCFSPYMDGQDPNLGSLISERQIKERLHFFAPYTQWVRTFGCGNGLERIGEIAHAMGFRTAIGAWLSNDTVSNDQEIERLITIAKTGGADMVIVGSEVLLRNDLTSDQLIEYIKRVKDAIPDSIKVTTVDVYGELLSHPEIIAHVDVVMANFYPYWEKISVANAIQFIHAKYREVVSVSEGKPVIVSEAGWPSAGDVMGDAVPSPSNASFFFLNFTSWARANSVPYFYFSAFDESWKAGYEGPQGAHWGVWDKDGNLKEGMREVFDGKTATDNWSDGTIPGGEGQPIVEFTKVPPFGMIGPVGGTVAGQVWHINPSSCKVAVYIHVLGYGWINKPYWNDPLTSINADGSWRCSIITGGVDERADIIAAYLIPPEYTPPTLSGGDLLSPELDEKAITFTIFYRPLNQAIDLLRINSTNGKIISMDLNGKMFQSDDEGLIWKPLGINSKRSYSYDMIFQNTELICCGWMYYNTGIFRSTDEGDTWVFSNKGLPENLQNNSISTMIENSANKLFVAVNGHGIYTSSHYADNWSPFNTDLSDSMVTCLSININDKMALGTDNGRIFINQPYSDSVEDQKPFSFSLSAAHPNPFNPSTTISFSLSAPGKATIAIYSITGQRVRTLLSGSLSAGSHSVSWDGRDDSGKPVSSGVYLSRLIAGKQTATGKILLLR